MTTLADKLDVQRTEQQSTALTTERKDILGLIASEGFRQQVGAALPRVPGLEIPRFLRIFQTTLRTNPKLFECDVRSLQAALMTSAELGLEPGGPLGHAYLVPFGKEVTLIVGYQGYIALAYRSGVVDNVSAELVREGDEFDVTLGAHRDLIHKPNKYDRSGKVQIAYAVCTLKDGGAPIFDWLTTAQVEERRSRSRAKSAGPWVTDWDQMARKTAVRALKPFLPMAVQSQLAQADAVDDTPLIIDSPPVDDGETSKPIVIDSAPPSNGAPAPAPEAEEKPKRTRRSRTQTPPEPAAAQPPAPPPPAPPSEDSPHSPGNGTPAVQEPSAGPATGPAPSSETSSGGLPSGEATAAAPPESAGSGGHAEPTGSTAQMRETADKIIWLRNDAIALHPQVATKDRAQLRVILSDAHYFESGMENARLWINTLGEDDLTSLVAAYRAVLFPPPELVQQELPT